MRVKKKVAVGVATAALAITSHGVPAGATHDGPDDEASCVAYFVTGISPGARGPFLSSTGAQNPAFHPFGENVVSVQAQSARDACPFEPPPL